MAEAEICVVTASFPVGPGEAFLVEEFAALQEAGARLEVVPLWPRQRRGTAVTPPAGIALCVRRLVFDPRILVAATLGLLRQPRAVGGWLWRLASTGSLRQRIANLLVLPKAIWLARHLRGSGVRHVHAHWAATTATCAMVAADLAGLPWSMTCHRWDIYEANLLALKGGRAAFVRFISQRGLADGVRLGVPADKALLLGMGVACPAAPVTPPARQAGLPLRIVCAANLLPVKGHAYLIDAVDRLVRAGTPVTLDLAGDGELRAALQARAQACGLDDQVRFLGHLRHDELMARYRAGSYDLCVLASIELGHGEHEGVPVSLMEAMACGIPVLSTRTGSIEELLPRELGATVQDKSEAALAEAIGALAHDEPARLALAGRQQAIVRERSSAAIAARLLSRLSGAGARG